MAEQLFLSEEFDPSLYCVNARIVAHNFDWELFRPIEPLYYKAREAFNKGTQCKRRVFPRQAGAFSCPKESPKEEEPLLFDVSAIEAQDPKKINSNPKGAGREGECFFSLLKVWELAPYYETEQNGEAIWRRLSLNPHYRLDCGFQTMKDVPSARTLRRFNRIMYTYDLWTEVRKLAVLANIEAGIIDLSGTVAIDPTHFDGFAKVRNLVKECKECDKKETCENASYTCDMTDIVSKSKNYKLPGVKAALITDPISELPLSGMPFNARIYDGKAEEVLIPLLLQLRDEYPLLKERINQILADGAFDSKGNRDACKEILDAYLLAPINPRNHKASLVNDRGIAKIDKYGVPHCICGHKLCLLTRDTKREQYIWGCPVFNPDSRTEGLSCDKKGECSPNSQYGRTYRTNRCDYTQIDWETPQHLKSNKKEYRLRSSIERTISRVKRCLPFEKFWNRGKKALQAHIDRLILALNMFAYAAMKLGKKHLIRSPLHSLS